MEHETSVNSRDNRIISNLKPLYDSVHISPEPEVEECKEDVAVYKAIEGGSVDLKAISEVKNITHDPKDLACIHCKLKSKVSSLQEKISKTSKEIEKMQETLSSKKVRNEELKKILNLIQGSINSPGIEEVSDTHINSCSCSKGCMIV